MSKTITEAQLAAALRVAFYEKPPGWYSEARGDAEKARAERAWNGYAAAIFAALPADDGPFLWDCPNCGVTVQSAMKPPTLPDTGLDVERPDGVYPVPPPVDMATLIITIHNLTRSGRRWSWWEGPIEDWAQGDSADFAVVIAREYERNRQEHARLTSKEWGTEPHTSPTAEES